MSSQTYILADKPLTFDPKRTNERLIHGFDFKQVMASNETIVSGSWAVFAVRPTTASTSGMVVGSAVFSGTRCTQMIGGGDNGALYSVVCTVDTDLGQQISENALLLVTDSAYK